jgi:hypothetical protein
MGTIELHAWGAKVDDVKRPDRLIFDLDPAPDVPWEAVKHAAREVRANLKKFDIVSFLKTTGGKGLHVVVPFARGPTWWEAKQFARAFANAMANDAPDRFTINSRKDVGKDASLWTICGTTKRRAPLPPMPWARGPARRYPCRSTGGNCHPSRAALPSVSPIH